MPDREVNFREIMSDLGRGMPDSQIMRKYKLTSRGLSDLYQQLVEAGFLVRTGQTYRIANKRQIKLEKLMEDIRSGLGESELRQKYRCSPWAFHKLMRKLHAHRKVNDHGLPQHAFDPFGPQGNEFIPRLPRNYLLWPYPVYVLGDNEATGWILDITEYGARIEGIEVQPNEARTFSVIASDVCDAKPFVMDAVCKWVQKGPSGSWVAGFEIPRMSAYNLCQLQKFIQAAAPAG
ncbi:MAG: hypothetical protein HY912_16215 [Desulfomonile tiedjei]|uniref:PilZ domain-containing protein n=1 Tax=Desulfomonile tiedjei TaxID=2358 RepID=A0A9D6V5K1_9BACT|nr:hypothetical protein [Desulfomonile tiedjei]